MKRIDAARPAFSLVELLIALAIIAVIAAALYPSIGAQLRGGQATALASQLDNLRQAIANYRTNVSRHPIVLTHLTTQPTTGAVDACGSALSGPNMAAWRGPYISTPILATGIPVGDVTIQNTMTRNPPTLAGGTIAFLQIRVVDVEQKIADDLERQFDSDPPVYTTGTILWGPAAGLPANTMLFRITIRGC